MKLLPLDIKQQRFRKVFRGYTPLEVHSFLELVAQTFEEIIKENNSLKDELRRHINKVNDFRDKETTLKDTMLTAQKVSEDVKENAKREAELMVKESELKAERIIGEAHQKMLKIMDRIQELKLDKVRFASELKNILDLHGKLLESTQQEDGGSDKDSSGLAFLKTVSGRAKKE